MMMGGPGMMPGRGGCGCSSILMIIVVFVMVMAFIAFFNNLIVPNQFGITQGGGPQHITQSTRVREPLPRNAAIDTGRLFTDNLNWIQNTTQMEAGLRNFHNATGVRPHVYITGDINGNTTPTPAEVEAFSIALYDTLFDDEAHLLLVFFESVDYPDDYIEIYLQPGIQARLVMDGEALDILFDYIEFYDHRFHTVGDVSMEQVFSNAFDRAAERIMHRPPDNRAVWMTVIIVGGVVLVLLILYTFWKKRQEQKRLEAEETERILSQNLTTFGESGGDEASRLAQQYMNDDED